MRKCEVTKAPQTLQLTPEQEAEARRLTETIAVKTKEELLQITRLLVSTRDVGAPKLLKAGRSSF